MSLADNLLHQFAQIADNLDVTGLLGWAYCCVRPVSCFKDRRRSLLIVLALPVAYMFAVTVPSMMGETSIAERYYRPVLPLLLMVGAVGWYKLLSDIGDKKWIMVMLAVLIGGNLVDMLDDPVRAHRAPQTQAGKWLQKQDPEYDGYVWSDYSQAAYFTGMEYLPAGAIRWVRRNMPHDGREVKYAMFEPEVVEVKPEDRGQLARHSPRRSGRRRGDGGRKQGEAEGSAGDEGQSQGAEAGATANEISVDGVPAATGKLRLNHKWHEVNYGQEFDGPPVILSSVPTFNGSGPGVIRLNRRSETSCRVRFQELTTMDGPHAHESLRWVAVQPGSRQKGGTMLVEVQARKIEACRSSDAEWTAFPTPFERKPVVFAQVQTNNDDRPVVARVKDVHKDGFSVFLQPEEGTGEHDPEVVGYVAVDPRVTGIGKLNCIAGRFTEDVGRGENLRIGEVRTGFRFQEGRTADRERRHAAETIGVMTINNDEKIFAQIQTCNELDFVTLRLQLDGARPIERYVNRNEWELIYREPERNIHIYRNPDYLPTGE